MNAINAFLETFEQERPQWEMLREHAVHLCKAGLNSIGVQGIVTSRVKTNASLEKKLQNRHTTIRPYANHESIMADQMDFVGLRIALYFPNQKKQVIDMLRDKFQYDDVRAFDRDWRPNEPGVYQHLFGQYVADHIWVRLRPEDQGHAAVSSKHAGYRFEIQLRSVLMDAWAGISQDLEYKALSGELTIPEHKLLDAIKGHVEVGELMLEQLHRVHRKRVETENERITTVRELGEVLVDSVPDSQLVKVEIGDLEALLTGLRVVESDTPAGLRALLSRVEAKTKLRDGLEQWKHDFYPTPGTLSFFLLEKLLPDVSTERDKFLIVCVRGRELQRRPWFESTYWQHLLWLSGELLHLSTFQASPPVSLKDSSAVRNFVHIWCAEFYLNHHGPADHLDECVLDCLSHTQEHTTPGLEFLISLCVLGLAPHDPRYQRLREDTGPADNEARGDDRYAVLAAAMQKGYDEQPQAWFRGINDFCTSAKRYADMDLSRFLSSADIALWLMSVREVDLLSRFLQCMGMDVVFVPEKETCWGDICSAAKRHEDAEMVRVLDGGAGFRMIDPLAIS